MYLEFNLSVSTIGDIDSSVCTSYSLHTADIPHRKHYTSRTSTTEC